MNSLVTALPLRATPRERDRRARETETVASVDLLLPVQWQVVLPAVDDGPGEHTRTGAALDRSLWRLGDQDRRFVSKPPSSGLPPNSGSTRRRCGATCRSPSGGYTRQGRARESDRRAGRGTQPYADAVALAE
jgi:hypothetical protein